uniref:Uncharacterized protein n=1 Tax=Ficedula albicollis TaxID=59894 RepID=A0A803VST3_FICAL
MQTCQKQLSVILFFQDDPGRGLARQRKEQMSLFLANAGCSDRMKEINIFSEAVFSTRNISYTWF